MADKKISQLPAATVPLVGTEVLPIVKDSTTNSVSVADLTAGRVISAAAYIPSSSTVPTNGMYLAAANVTGIGAGSSGSL